MFYMYYTKHGEIAMSVSKGATISTRLTQKTGEAFDRLSELMQINKSDFVRICVEKLCKDNRIYLEHMEKTKQYSDFIRREMAKISEDMIVVKDGSWKTVTDNALLMLCDLLFRWSSKVFDTWFSVLVEYGLTEGSRRDAAKEEFEDGLIALEDIGFILSSMKAAVDIEALIEDEKWWDEIEVKKASLLLATKQAIQKYSAEYIIKEVLERTAKYEQEPTIIVVDAAGKFKRSGSIIKTPAEYEKASKIKANQK